MPENPPPSGTEISAIADRLRAFYSSTPPAPADARARVGAALARADHERHRRVRKWRAVLYGSAAAALVLAVTFVARQAGSPTRAESEIDFTFSAPAAKSVALVGNFNEWNVAATPLRHDPATGRWSAAVRLGPGRHAYAYVIDGRTWVVDPLAARAEESDYGPTNALFVSDAGR